MLRSTCCGVLLCVGVIELNGVREWWGGGGGGWRGKGSDVCRSVVEDVRGRGGYLLCYGEYYWLGIEVVRWKRRKGREGERSEVCRGEVEEELPVLLQVLAGYRSGEVAEEGKGKGSELYIGRERLRAGGQCLFSYSY